MPSLEIFNQCAAYAAFVGTMIFVPTVTVGLLLWGGPRSAAAEAEADRIEWEENE